MTLLELSRAVDSKLRVEKRQAQERASYDYILGDLIGQSIARVYSSSARYPDIAAVYPSLFDSQEIQAKKREQQSMISAIRFKQFAASHNAKYGGKQ